MQGVPVPERHPVTHWYSTNGWMRVMCSRYTNISSVVMHMVLTKPQVNFLAHFKVFADDGQVVIIIVAIRHPLKQS